MEHDDFDTRLETLREKIAQLESHWSRDAAEKSNVDVTPKVAADKRDEE